MDGPLLQTPKTGHSRFSKALPAPPPEPGRQDNLKIIPRKLPSLPSSPFPPRKDSASASAKATANPNSKLNSLDTALPALPAKMESTQLLRQANSIPRRPVGGQSSPQSATPSSVPRTTRMKRVSSISSILSAYSRTSSDSVHRSSQDSYHTKDSEPSYSPEREGIDQKLQEPTRDFSVFTGNPYADEMPQRTGGTREIDQFPPPPPKKDAAPRPSTPSTIRPMDSPSLPNGTPLASSPGSSVNGSPRQREIWRRRASSKSDRSLAVAGLKLTTSHGSTAATLQAVKADPLPPPPAHNSTPTTAPLPPRGASLPGRNIRPNRQAAPENNKEMVRIPGVSKLKELAKRGSSSKDSSKEDHQLQDRAQGQVESEAKVASPIRYQPGTDEPAHGRGPVAEVVAPAASSMSSPEYPPGESARKVISRRPVGNSKRDNQGLQKQQQSTPELISPSSRKSPTQPTSGGSRRSPSPRSSSRVRKPRSNSALNSAATHNVQETVMAKAPAAPVRSPVAQAPGPEQTKAATAQPRRAPANADEPLKKPELFELASTLNERDASPKDSTPRKTNAPAPSRRVAPNTPAVPLSDVNEAAEDDGATKGAELTEEQAERLNHALSRFPRDRAHEGAGNRVWRAAPLAEKHHRCYTRHGTFVFAKNASYALACQACGAADGGHRKVCSWCNLRICAKCHGALLSHGRDLGALVAALEEERRLEKGKDKEVLAEPAVAGNTY